VGTNGSRRRVKIYGLTSTVLLFVIKSNVR